MEFCFFPDWTCPPRFVLLFFALFGAFPIFRVTFLIFSVFSPICPFPLSRSKKAPTRNIPETFPEKKWEPPRLETPALPSLNLFCVEKMPDVVREFLGTLRMIICNWKIILVPICGGCIIHPMLLCLCRSCSHLLCSHLYHP